MADILRTFRVPVDLKPRQREQLEEGCGALQARQHAFGVGSPAAVAAHDVVIDAAILRLRYRVDGGQPIVDAGHIADSEFIRDWARQICSTLAAAYPAGQAALMPHGGLTRDNVLLDSQGRIRILDFGVAECITGALEPTDEFWLRQTAATAAPELWSQPSSWGQQSDLFAAGVLLYELATGAHPYGARAEDPDDCKFRMVTELASSPRARGSTVDDLLSALIHDMVQREPRLRCPTFGAALARLEQQPPETRPEPDAPSRPAEPAASGAEDADQQRRQYLQAQQDLRRQREAAKRRQAVRRRRRRDRLSAVNQFVRAHVVLVCVSTIVLVGLATGLTLFGMRLRNDAIVRREFERLTASLSERFQTPDGRLASLALELTPSRTLVAAFENLHEVAPDTTLAFGEPLFEDFYHSIGSSVLAIDDLQLEVPFRCDRRAERGLSITIDGDALGDLLIEASEQLALRQLPVGALATAEELLPQLKRAQTVAEASAVLRAVSSLQDPLGYLAHRGDRARLILGAFGPIPGTTGLTANAGLATLDGTDIIEAAVELRLLLSATARPQGWGLSDVRLIPREEPEAHQRWCMNETLEELRRAFDDRDAKRLAELTHPADLPRIQAMMAWVARCAGATLINEPVHWSAASVKLLVEFDAGLPGAQQLSSDPLTLEFDSQRAWRIRSDRAHAWPAAPITLLHAEKTAELQSRFRKAWESRDAAAYLALFPGHRRSVEDVEDMFRQIVEDDIAYDIKARGDPEGPGRVLIELRPHASAEAARRGHVSKLFGFEIQSDALIWDRRDDPVWVFAGKHFATLTRRLLAARWHAVSDIQREFDKTAAQDMTTLERAKIEQWIGAIDQARQMFEPLSEEFEAGFPARVGLRGAGPERLTFHRVRRPHPEPHYVYIQGREFHRADLGGAGRAKPWRPWEPLVGPAPDGQIVGLSYDDAAGIARRFDCTLPTAEEWRAAAAALGDSPSNRGKHAFYGGVWEFCAEPDRGDARALVLGGSWYDFDPQLVESGLSTTDPDRFEARVDRFGTVGFRLCKRFRVPPEAMPDAAVPGPGDDVRQSRRTE